MLILVLNSTISLSSFTLTLINISDLKSSYTPSSNINCFPSNKTLISSSIRFLSLLNKATITLFSSRSAFVIPIIILLSCSKYLIISVSLVYSLNLISCFPVYLISPDAVIRRFNNDSISPEIGRFGVISVAGILPIEFLLFLLGLGYFRSTGVNWYSLIYLIRYKSTCLLLL